MRPTGAEASASNTLSIRESDGEPDPGGHERRRPSRASGGAFDLATSAAAPCGPRMVPDRCAVSIRRGRKLIAI